jgi:hypothetical protein
MREKKAAINHFNGFAANSHSLPRPSTDAENRTRETVKTVQTGSALH